MILVAKAMAQNLSCDAVVMKISSRVSLEEVFTVIHAAITSLDRLPSHNNINVPDRQCHSRDAGPGRADNLSTTSPSLL